MNLVTPTYIMLLSLCHLLLDASCLTRVWSHIQWYYRTRVSKRGPQVLCSQGTSLCLTSLFIYARYWKSLFTNCCRSLVYNTQGHEDVAHRDAPLKEGNVHISAPHIYGSALEALELVPDSSMSFLSVGSGTGYLSCIVADILGYRSLNFGA